MRLYWIIPFIIFFLFIAIIWNIPVAKFSETLPVTITISEPGEIGEHTTREPQKMFNFGTTFPGTKVQKILNWTTVSKNYFVLDELTQVEVTLTIPDDAEKGRNQLKSHNDHKGNGYIL